MNSLGEIIVFKELNQKQTLINLNDLKSGIYFIVIENNSYSVTKKIIKL
jgi:hypothetical protein